MKAGGGADSRMRSIYGRNARARGVACSAQLAAQRNSHSRTSPAFRMDVLFSFVVTLTCISQSGGQLEIGILDGFSSTLRYLNGNCSWRITVNVAENEVENEVGVGPQRTLVGGDGGSERFTLRCVTENGEKLNAIISTHGKEWITVFTYHELLSVTQLRALSHHEPNSKQHHDDTCCNVVTLHTTSFCGSTFSSSVCHV